MHVIDVPERYHQGMQLSGVQSGDDSEHFVVDVGYFSGKGSTDVRTLRLTAFTTVGPVTFEEFPDNAIWDFSASSEVGWRGAQPTLAEFPERRPARISGRGKQLEGLVWRRRDSQLFVRRENVPPHTGGQLLVNHHRQREPHPRVVPWLFVRERVNNVPTLRRR